MVPEKSIGTGIGKIWYRKKVSEPVSEKFGTRKKSQNRYRKNLVLKKVPEPISENLVPESFGTSIKNETLIFVAKI